MADDIVIRLVLNADAIQWEQPVSAERHREAAEEIKRLREALRCAIDELMIYGPHYQNEPWWLKEGWNYMNEARRG